MIQWLYSENTYNQFILLTHFLSSHATLNHKQSNGLGFTKIINSKSLTSIDPTQAYTMQMNF